MVTDKYKHRLLPLWLVFNIDHDGDDNDNDDVVDNAEHILTGWNRHSK